MKNFAFDLKLNIQKLKNWCPVWLIVLFIGALVIRIIGVWYGLPLHLNIDEPSTISSAVEIKHNLNPGRFDWPHLYFYINAAAYAVYAVIRSLISSVDTNTAELYGDSPLFLISRSITAIFGALTIFPVYNTAKKLFKSNAVGYLAAIMIACLPIHVSESHLAKLDVAQTFFVAMAFYYIVRVFSTGRKRFFIYAGIWIGLSTSVKYNGFLLFLPLILAVLLRAQNYRELLDFGFIKDNVKKLFMSGVVSIVFFYLGTPFALLDYSHFWSYEPRVGALWQFKNVGKIPASQYPAAVYETFFKMYPQNMGIGIWILFIFLIVLFLFFNKRGKGYVLTIFPAFLLSMYISSFERSPEHYFIFLIPLYLPALAGFLMEIRNKINIKRMNNYAYAGLFALLIVPSIYSSGKISYLYSREDTRDTAFKWVQNNINNDTDLLYVYGPDLADTTFKKGAEALKRVDRGNIKFPTPFYLMIGQEGITHNEVMNGSRDPSELAGNSGPILRTAELLFEQDDVNRLGPPIYIFKVNNIVSSGK